MTVSRNRSLLHRPRQFGRPVECGFVALFLALALAAAAQHESIVNSKHNLSASGPGPVKAVSEDRICIFCHTPHGARDAAPLWNRNDSTMSYVPYQSPTLKAQPGQPTGSSKLCLSCHDGTVALGDLVSESTPIAMSGSQFMPAGPGLIGTDLRDDHPVSFAYSESLAALPGQMSSPASWDPRVKLDDQGMLQCTTCHDAHDDQWGSFLVMDNIRSMLCRQCHTFPDFDQTPHAESTRQWNGAGENPWLHTPYEDVQSNACLNCHQSHHAQGPIELVTRSREEDVCLVCHDGSVTQADLATVFQKPFHHPVETSEGVHQPGESPSAAFGHVECADCHNPHRARNVDAEAPLVPGVLEGVSGIDAGGLGVDEARYEYEVCFKCHSRDNALPFNAIRRQVSSSNLRNKFSLSSPSYHPVEGQGQNLDVPSLISPLNSSSVIYCKDCHGNSDPGADTAGTQGPHGSDYEFILVRDYKTGEYQQESQDAYALCYGCHSRDSILADESFAFHFKHVVEEEAPCSICHDAHGIDVSKGGTPENNAHLINFNTDYVEPDTVTNLLEYRTTAPGAGECSLRCHQEDHSAREYPSGGGGATHSGGAKRAPGTLRRSNKAW